jgi:hypothetical protein
MRHPKLVGIAIGSAPLIIIGIIANSGANTTQMPTNAPNTTQAPVTSSPVPAQTPTQVHDPGHVTGTMLAGCHTRDGGQLPDSRCTPGSYDPAMTTARICAYGYRTARYRPPEGETSRAKWDIVEPAYGQHDVRGELDHLIPLELGGSNDLSNLWVEAGSIPNSKDAVEDRLHDEVCSGQIALRAAQVAIATNWRNV